MTYDEVIRLAEEVFDEEYSRLDKDSFLIGFQEAYNAIMALYKDKFELVKQMREAQKRIKGYSPTRIEKDRCQWENDLDNKAYLESEVDEYLKKIK